MSFADFKLIGIQRFPTSLYMWGDNTNGLLGDNRTPSYFSWSKISSGGLHTLAIRSDGTLFAWGRNTDGQLGDATTTHRSSPVQIGTSAWLSVSAGISHSSAVKADYTLWTWGGNRYGQLGDSTTVSKSSPVQAPAIAGPTVQPPYSWISVASGKNHTIAVSQNGLLFAWGLGNSGQTGISYSPNIVGVQQGGILSDDLSAWGSGWNIDGFVGNGTTGQVNTLTQIHGPWLSLKSNRNTRIGIKLDSTLWGMGTNSSGELGDGTTVGKSRIVSLSTDSWTMISVGPASTILGIKKDGSLWAWGNNNAGMLGDNSSITYRSSPVQIGTSSWSFVSAGYIHSAGITVDGSLYTWGNGNFGQLGLADGTTINRSSPTQVGVGSSWSQVSAGSSQTYAIRSDGILFASGYNAFYFLGGFPLLTASSYNTLTQHNNDTWSNIFSGQDHYGAIGQKTNGTLWSMGGNADGWLGVGDAITRSSPVQLGSGLFNGSWTQITSAESAGMRGLYNGLLYVWGWNPQNELGLGLGFAPRSNPVQVSLPAYTAAPITRSFPVQISSLYSWINVDAGLKHAHILDSAGMLYALGNNVYGELGDGTTINRSSPVQIGTSSWSTVSSGGTHTAAITSTGSLFTWGLNSSGQLGLNTTYSGNFYTQISEGLTHTLAIRNDGALFVWGQNQYGQLGTNDTINRSSPIQIGTSSWSSIDAGNSHSVAVTSDGKLFSWGANDWGQLGNNPSTVNITWSKISVSSSGSHTVAIRNDGTLWAWGLGTTGQLGLNDLVTRNSPTQIGSLNTWIDVAVGSNHSMGITNDNVLYTWGSASFGVLGDGTVTTKSSPIVVGYNYQKVFAGYQTSIAIDNNNLTYIWGDNTNGLIPGGVVATHRSSIALLNTDTNWRSFAIDQHILGIKNDGSLWAWGLGTIGQLGLGDLISRSSPVQVGTSSWSMVSAGVSYSVGITTDNSLYAWGWNGNGQLGLSDTVNRSSPATVGAAAGLSDSNAYSTYFNGSATYLTIPKEAITMSSSGSTTNPTYTVECWYYRSGGGYHSILATSGSTSPTFNFMVDNTRNISLNVGGTQTVGSTILSLNKWYHIALTRNPTGVSNNAVFNVYLNGVLEFTMNDTDPMRNVEPYCIANDFTHGVSQYLIGYISNYRISNKIVYTGNFTVPTSSLGLTQSAGTNIASLTSGEVKFLSLNTNTSTPIDASTNAYTITVSGTITPSTLTPFTTAIATGSTIATNVVAGFNLTLMTDSASNLYAWGLNSAGQLGLNDTVGRSSPVKVGTEQYNNILAGNSFSVGVRTDNSLFIWGVNSSGQLGDTTTINRSSPVQISTTTANYSSPVQISTSNYTSVSAGEGHTLSLGVDGILYGWGKNDNAQVGGAGVLGIGWSKVVVGPTHSLGIRFDGKLYAWGNNATGQIGDGTTTNRSSPVQLGTNTWKDITVGQGSLYYSLAITTDGRLFAWGNNQVGQLGYMSWRQISVGTGHSLALRSDGALYAMGLNTAGQLGDPTFGVTNRSSPVQIGTSSWSIVNAGVSTSAAIDSTGRLFTWGYNNVGQLGLATTANRSSPVQVSSGSWSQVAVEDYMLGITTQGSMWVWGNNNVGQLGLGTTVNSKVPKLLDGTTTSYSIGFDGIGDYLNIPQYTPFLFSALNFTMECWIHPTTTGVLRGIVNNWNGGGAFGWRITAANVLEFAYTGAASGIQTNTYTGTTLISANTWTHVAIVRNGNTLRFYINGTADTSSFSMASFPTIYFYNGVNKDLRIGVNDDLTGYLNGYISNLRIVKGQALYTSNFTPTTSPLTTTSQGISSGTVSLLTAQNATIIDNSSNGFTITATGTPTVTQYNPFSVISSTSSTSWTRVAAGTHSLAIRNDGLLYAWGLNSSGQLGDSTTVNKSSPIQIGSSSWTLVSASMTGHSLAVDNTGTLYSWGNNVYGELGLNNEFVNVSSPTQIAGYVSFTSISTGYNTSLGITTINNINTAYGWGLNNYNQLATINAFSWRNVGVGSGIQANIGLTYGKLYTWGDNTYGQLGNNTTIARSSPTQVGGFYGGGTYKFIVSTILNTAFIANDNTLYMMGDNTYGQLGQGDTISRSSPVQVGTGQWSTIAISGTGHALAINASGTLFSWGRNDYNELGQNENVVANRSSPVNIGGNSDWTKVSAGNNFSTALNATGNLYVWGRNDTGQLGYSIPLSYTNIGAGMVSRNDGKMYTWGNNGYGQIGNNSTNSRSAPTQIDSVAFASTSWTSVSSSDNNKASIKIDGKLFVWGDNTYGQLGVSEGPEINPSRSQPVQILGSWTQVYVTNNNIFAIRNDSSLWAWGNNSTGQLGLNDTINRSSPVQIGSSSWTQIVASNTGHILGLKADSTLYAWGNNEYNELGQNQTIQITYSSPVQVGTSSWTKISAGNNSSFAIRTDGALFGWGRNNAGQIGTNVVTPLSWTQIAAGDSYSVAIRSDGKLFSWGRNDKGQLGLSDTIVRNRPAQVAPSTYYNLYSTYFNGTTDNLGASGATALNLGTNSCCIEMWLYPIVISSAGSIIIQNGTGNLAILLFNNGILQPGNYGTTGFCQTGTGAISPLVWSHFALTRDGSNNWRLFVNGILQAYQNYTLSCNLTNTGIGGPVAGTNVLYNGYMSNLRIVNGSIPTSYVTTSTTIGTPVFTPSTVPLTTTSQGATAANVALLTMQNSRYVDNSNTPITLASAGAPNTSTLTPFSTTIYNYSWTQVSATLSHTVAIRNDGTLWGWGDNSAGQLGQNNTVTRSDPIQISSSSWTNVFAGLNSTYAIRTDGALFSVGDNTYGQLGQSDRINRSSMVQLGTSSWTTISASQTGHVLGILSTGALYTWGYNVYGQLGNNTSIANRSSPVQIGTSSWTKVSAGNNFSAALRNDGGLFTWGDNQYGQLAAPSTALGWVKAGSGIALRADGKLFTWGGQENGAGQNVNNTAYKTSPTQLGVSLWTAIGDAGGIAVRVDGTLWTWYQNINDSLTATNGQTGINDILQRSSPVQVGTDTDWMFVASNRFTRAAIKRDNRLYIWGDLASGSGIGDNISRSSPIQIPGSWTQVSMLKDPAFAGLGVIQGIKTDGTLWSWGFNVNGQLGDGTTIDKNSPVQVAGSWIQISTGKYQAAGLKSDGTIWAWGQNQAGQLGQNDRIYRSSPVQIGTNADNSWTQITCTGVTTAAIRNDGSLWVWGDGIYAGLNSTVLRSSPVQLGTSSWSFIGTKFLGLTGILSTGQLYGWGDNTEYNIGNGATGATLVSSPVVVTTTLATTTIPLSLSSPVQVGTSSWTQVQAGSSWTAGVLTTGGLYTWGAGVNGELGSGATASRSSPVQVGLLTTWSRLAGNTHVISTTTAGALFAWGFNNAGQLGDNTTVAKSSPVSVALLTNLVFDNVSSPTQIGTSSWTQIAAGDLYTTALRYLDGGLFTWGLGSNGRLGSGATTSRSSPVQVGTSSWAAVSTGGTENTVALTIAYTLFSWGRNNNGQVGDATTVDKSAPTAVGAALNLNLMTDVIKTVTQLPATATYSWGQVSAGGSHVIATRSDNTLWTWGSNNNGQLGQTIATSVHRSSPVQVGTSTWNVISAGGLHSLGITTTGNLQGWGRANEGQLGDATTVTKSVPTALGTSSWTIVSAGLSTSIGTTTSNLTFVWGGNEKGQLGLYDVAGRSSPTQLGSNLAAGMYQTIFVSPVIVNTGTTASWTQIGIGDVFGVGIENSGRLYAWGRNNNGQLGDGSTIDNTPTKSSPTQIGTTASSFTFINTSSPVQVGTSSWNTVVAGGTHTVAIRTDGTLWAWGQNNFGQVGTLSTLNQYMPKQIDIQNSYTTLAAGFDFSAALKTDNTLWRWGYNTNTDIVNPHRSNPVQLGLDTYSKIKIGGNTAVAINLSNLLYGWGKITTDDNFNFNLGISPITWGVGFSYRDINAGDSFIHAIRTDYSLWGYGYNNSGQLGDSSILTRSSPVQLGTGYSWSIVGNGVSATPLHAGTLFLSGLNSSGQLGLNDITTRSSPSILPATAQPTFAYPVRIGTNRFIQVSAGNSHSMAIRDDYGLFAWGLNTSGQLGLVDTVTRSSPVQVNAGTSYIQVSAGRDHTGGIRLDNTLWMWGLNTRGQLGDSTTVNKNAPVQVAGYWESLSLGASHTVAVADNNTLYIWGDDNFGQ